MSEDPGWGQAIGLGLRAIFARGRVMKVRPAITAARAMLVPGVVNAVLFAWVLALLGGDDGEPDLISNAILLGAGVVAGLGGVLWARSSRRLKTSLDVDAQSLFVTRVTLMSAFANLPLLVGFIAFFLDGGYLFYAVGAVATLILLVFEARPTPELAERLGAVLDPPLTGDELWRLVLQKA